MDEREQSIAALHAKITRRQETEASRLVHDFMTAMDFPISLRMRLMDMKELYETEEIEGIFKQAFPAFPFHVGILPTGKARKISHLGDILGRGGTLIKAYDDYCSRNANLVADRVMGLLLRLPNMKDVYILHNAEREKPTGFQFTLESEFGYYLTLESAGNFLKSAGKSSIRKFIVNEISNSDSSGGL